MHLPTVLATWKFSRHINSWFCEGGDLAKNSKTASLEDMTKKCLPQAFCHVVPAEACVRARTTNCRIFSALRVSLSAFSHLPPPASSARQVALDFSTRICSVCVFLPSMPSWVFVSGCNHSENEAYWHFNILKSVRIWREHQVIFWKLRVSEIKNIKDLKNTNE